MINKKILGAAVAVTIGMSGTAHAFSVNTGFGTVDNIGGFDWSPNSGLSVASLPLSTDINDPTKFTLYSQASLASYTDTSGNAIASDFGLNSNYEVTFETGFGEFGLQSIFFAIFGFDPEGPVNFFNMYYDTVVDSNPLEGTGYGSSATSKLILSGVIVDGFGSFALNPFTPGTETLDQFNGDSWGGQQTLDGTGSNTVDVDIQTQNQEFNFFSNDMTAYILDMFFNSDASTPFRNQDPSRLVVGNTPNFGADNINGSCGVGERCDFLFETDARSTLKSSVPEPSAIALMGLGLLGMAGASRRRRS